MAVVCLSLTVHIIGQQEKEENAPSFETIEEVVVIGTLIPSVAESNAVPVTTIDWDELKAIAPSDFKDIIASLSFTSSSLGLSSSNWVGDDGSYGQASINVRNVGNGATLVLLNGRRVLPSQFDQNGGSYVDIQVLTPNIAIEHIDILKDGTSAIYGSDAIAGVANVVTRDQFRGLDVQFYISQDYESGQQRDKTLEVLYGTGTEKFQVSFAMSLLDRTELGYDDRFERFGRSGLSSFGQPGRYVPQVGESGPQPVHSNFWWPQGGPDPSLNIGSLPDLECEKVAEADGAMGTLGLHPIFTNICVYDYSSLFAIVRPESMFQSRVAGEYELDSLGNLYFSFSRFGGDSSGGNSLYPDVRYVIIPSHNFGLQLDAARRGFEPVAYQGMQRLVGGTSASLYEERPVDTRDKFERKGFDFVLALDTELEFLHRSWSTDLSVSISHQKVVTHLPTDVISERMDLAFDGFGGEDCNPLTDVRGSGNLGIGNCFYFNSFQTSVYDPASGEKWIPSDLPWTPNPSMSVSDATRLYTNPPELLQWLHGVQMSDREVQQQTIDFSAFSDVARIGIYPIGFAWGFQFRSDEAATDYDPISNRFGFSFLNGDSDWNAQNSHLSLFTELNVPFTRELVANIALRHTQQFDPNTDSLDPKVSFRFNPRSDVTLRGSWGTSFKTGSLLQTGGNRSIFRNSSDPFSNAVSLAYRVSQAQGNPKLKPQDSTSLNLGVTWKPIDTRRLRFDMDLYAYEYRSLIVREGHQALIDRDNQLRCPSGINGDPSTGPLCGVWDHDGDGITSVFSIGQGIPDQVIRREDGYLVRTEPKYFNAHRLNTNGLDFAVSYLLSPTLLGEFKLKASLSRCFKYSLTLDSGETLDGLGKRNKANAIGRPMPVYKGRLSVLWSRATLSGSVHVNALAGYDDTSTQSTFLGAYIGTTDYIESMTTIDVQLRWTIKDWMSTVNSEVTFGIKNLLNEDPPLVTVDGAYDYYSHDPRGRIFFLNFRYVREGQN